MVVRRFGRWLQQDDDDQPRDLGQILDDYASQRSSGSNRDDRRDDRGRNARTPVGDIDSDWRVRPPRPPSTRALEGWSAQIGGPGSTSTGPRYFMDDVQRPASRGTDAIIALQRAMMVAGYLSPNDDFRWGSWRGKTVDAYEDLLAEANVTGLSWEEMLEQSAMGISNRDGGGTYDPITGEWIEDPQAQFVAPPLELRTTNKEDLKRVFLAATQDAMGQAWAPEQIDELIQAYNWREIQLQKDAYDATVSRMEQEFEFGEGRIGADEISDEPIEILSAPSPETFAEEEMKRQDPEGYQANAGMELLLGLIDQWGGGR